MSDTWYKMGPRRDMAVRNPSECHSRCLHLSLSLHPDGYQLIAKLPLTCWQVRSGGSCIFHPTPSHFHILTSLVFFPFLYFWSVWVNSTKGNFLFTLQRAFSLTRWHCDNALWELRMSLMRCKCKYTTKHTSTSHLKTCTVTCYRKGLCGMMTSASYTTWKCGMCLCGQIKREKNGGETTLHKKHQQDVCMTCQSSLEAVSWFMDRTPSSPVRHEKCGEEDMSGTARNNLILEFKASTSCLE